MTKLEQAVRHDLVPWYDREDSTNVFVEQAEQESVHEALQIASVALQDIACSSQTKNLYWWQIRAREAQKQIAERLTNSAPAEPVKQEPVAWAHPSGGYLSARYMKEFATGLEKETYTIPLYAAPVRTKDLTDDEIYTLYSEPCSDREMIEFARAVIKKFKEKNNANNNT